VLSAANKDDARAKHHSEVAAFGKRDSGHDHHEHAAEPAREGEPSGRAAGVPPATAAKIVAKTGVEYESRSGIGERHAGEWPGTT